MYLADSGKSRNVTSIASVSGGSLINGAVAESVDYHTTDAAGSDETGRLGIVRRDAAD